MLVRMPTEGQESSASQARDEETGEEESCPQAGGQKGES